MAHLLLLLKATWRVRFQGRETFERFYTSGTPFVLCFWHGKYVPVFPLFRGYRACVLTSLSARGDVLAAVCRSFGYEHIQIPDHGGGSSFQAMVGAMSGAAVVAIAVDGPLGPYHLVKKGVIRLASVLGFPLLPLSLEAGNKMVLVDRWDKMEIPKPFSRLEVIIGDPILVPPGISTAEEEAWTARLAGALETLDRRAGQALGGSL